MDHFDNNLKKNNAWNLEHNLKQNIIRNFLCKEHNDFKPTPNLPAT